MKKFAIALALFCATPAFAGRVKEIYIMATESVMDYLGFDESVIQIEGVQFVQVEGADVAVETIARSYFSREHAAPTFKCITTFKEVAPREFETIRTQCKEIK